MSEIENWKTQIIWVRWSLCLAQKVSFDYWKQIEAKVGFILSADGFWGLLTHELTHSYCPTTVLRNSNSIAQASALLSGPYSSSNLFCSFQFPPELRRRIHSDLFPHYFRSTCCAFHVCNFCICHNQNHVCRIGQSIPTIQHPMPISDHISSPTRFKVFSILLSMSRNLLYSFHLYSYRSPRQYRITSPSTPPISQMM